MSCDEFIARYSEFADRLLLPRDRRRCLAHLATCESCRRYSRVIARGRQVLAELPEPEPAHDFPLRLRHRLYSERYRAGGVSGISNASLFGMAAIIVALAWSPALWSSADEADGPAAAPGSAALPQPAAERVSGASLVSRVSWGSRISQEAEVPPVLSAGLWEDANLLLYEHSPVARRYRAEPLRERPAAPDS